MIGWVILLLALGDLVVFALLLKERRAHGKSRTALKFWRDRAGLTQVDMKGKGSEAALRAAIQANAAASSRDRIRLAQPGGVA